MQRVIQLNFKVYQGDEERYHQEIEHCSMQVNAVMQEEEEVKEKGISMPPKRVQCLNHRKWYSNAAPNASNDEEVKKKTHA
jgi:hypothetical protein